MKKLFVVLLALTLLCASAVAEGIDWASMTDEELHHAIDSARIELSRREAVFGEKVFLVDQDGVQLYLTGNYEYDDYGEGSQYLELEAVFINESGTNVGLSFDDVYVNGWNVYGSGVSNIESGKKSKGNINFNVADAEVTAYEQIEDIEISIHAYDGDSYQTLFSVDTVTIHLN